MLMDGAAPTAVQRWSEWVGLVSKIAVLIGGVLAGLWAYIRLVLEKGLVPPVEFDVTCSSAGVLRDRRVVEVLLRLKNVGSSTLICHNLRVDLKYLLESCDERNCAEPRLESDPENRLFGRLLFDHSLAEDLQLKNPISPPADRPRGFLVLPCDTFVQPAVSQAYPFVTTLPEKATHVLVWASFQYGVRPRFLQRVILHAGRALGLIQYSLTHVVRAHSIEHVFDLRPQQAEPSTREAESYVNAGAPSRRSASAP